jgi:hypothetical protein
MVEQCAAHMMICWPAVLPCLAGLGLPMVWAT